MDESVVFNLAEKVFKTIASPSFKKAYEEACSIWGARADLQEITKYIEAIQSILIDAEKHREGSAVVKVWITRIKDVLYDTDDLFDEVTTNDRLQKQMKGVWKHYFKEVHVFFSKKNHLVSGYSFVQKVKVIRDELKLNQISIDVGLSSISRVEEEGSRVDEQVRKSSYDYLSSNLKLCFVYCSLFPKNSIMNKKNLINLWIAQGYVSTEANQTLEEVGHSYFMELLGKSFFHEVKLDNSGEIESCKMHDLIHDLAKEVAGTGVIVLAEGLTVFQEGIRHVSVGRKIDESWITPPALFQATRIRSLLFMSRNDRGSFVLDREFTELRFLHALSLEGLNIKDVPRSIGRLKHLRYLNLSKNTKLTAIPNSITKLVNLMTLDLNGCLRLESLPIEFRKLISLRHLDISGCESLMHMPFKFGDLTCLQYLSDFKVSKDNGVCALIGLNLHGQLRISYDRKGDWSEDEMMLERGHIPESIDTLSIHDYRNVRIPIWWKEDPTALEIFKLKSLKLQRCVNVTHLPPLRRLPNLRELMMDELMELEYIEEEENVVDSNTKFFPSLVFLQFTDLPKLKGWSRRQEEAHFVEKSSFPCLSRLWIHNCVQLKSRSIPPSSRLEELSLIEVGQEMVQQLVSTTNASLSSLQSIKITDCSDMRSFSCEGLTSLRTLDLRGWSTLKNVEFGSCDIEELTILRCPKLKLWEHGEENMGVDWNSLAKLRVLSLDDIPKPEELPDCLRQRVDDHDLQIKRQIS